jgi:hypothetical protein
MSPQRFWLVGLCGLLVAVSPARGGNPSPATEPVKPRAKDAGAVTEIIDRFIAEKWAEAKVKPAPIAGDAEFLRRAYLDVVGKVPSVAEVRAFLDDPDPEKRAKVINRLLESPAYTNHFTRVWRSLLLPEADSDFMIRFLTFDFDAWLRKQVAENAGYDALARGIVAAPLDQNGQRQVNPFNSQGDPTPIAYFLAKEGKPENLAASTARLFLGVRIECAQCHDHPFARWKREQFWGYAAFFGGIQKKGEPDNFGQIREIPDRRELAIPGTERVVQASFLDGSEPQWRFKVGSRVTLAEWMTSAENPYFARAGVNRIWAHFFGTGLVDPVDDLGEDKAASHPELFDELANQFAAHDYDIKFLIRALTASRAYQLTSDVTEPTASPSPSDTKLLTQMAIKGLSADQLYESLAQATGLVERATGQNAFQEAINSPRAAFLQKFGRHDEKPTETQTSILQSLALMNGELMARATDPKRGLLLGAVADAPFLDTTARVETLYLAALGRRPRPEESARMVAYVESGGTAHDPKAALGDVLWSLLNCAEFMFNH